MFSVDTFNSGWLRSLAKCKEEMFDMMHCHVVDMDTRSLDVLEDLIKVNAFLQVHEMLSACFISVI